MVPGLFVLLRARRNLACKVINRKNAAYPSQAVSGPEEIKCRSVMAQASTGVPAVDGFKKNVDGCDEKGMPGK
jgi:hypothetical protein